MKTKNMTILNPANVDLLREKQREAGMLTNVAMQNLLAIKLRYSFLNELLETGCLDPYKYQKDVPEDLTEIFRGAVNDVLNLNQGLVEGAFTD